MSAALHNTTAIDFTDLNSNNQTKFDYSENELYNLSVPIFSILVTLERLPKPENLSIFKNLLKQQIVDLSEEGKKLQYPSAVIDKLCCLHCIVLDEFIIHSTWGAGSGWENNTLLSELFNLQSGGDLFFTVADKAMRQPEKMFDLLSIIYIFLQLGFKGRFRSRQSEKIGIVIKQIGKVVADDVASPVIAMKENVINKSLVLTSGRRYFSITLVIGVVIAMAAIFFDYWFKETYSSRTREIRELHVETSQHRKTDVNDPLTKSRQVLEANRLPSNKPQGETHTQPMNITEMADKEKVVIEPVSKSIAEQNVALKYRVQINTFSSQLNAENFIGRINNSRYELRVKPLGHYFIVYSVANTLQDAEQQKQYYQDQFQWHTIIFEQDNVSTPK